MLNCNYRFKLLTASPFRPSLYRIVCLFLQGGCRSCFAPERSDDWLDTSQMIRITRNPTDNTPELVITLRGSAAGVYGSDMKFSATNADASLACEGKFKRGSEKSVSGALSCTNGQTGKFRLNTINAKGGPYWRGEGRLSNGKSFQIFINYLTNPDKQ